MYINILDCYIYKYAIFLKAYILSVITKRKDSYFDVSISNTFFPFRYILCDIF